MIGTIAVLLAVTLPTLRGSRQRAESLVHLTGQRQCAAAIFSYCSDYKNSFPFIGLEQVGEKKLDLRGWRSDWPMAYFRVDSTYWPSLICPHYMTMLPDRMHAFETDPSADWFVWRGAGPRSPNPFISTNYRLTHTTSAAPEYWMTDEAPDDLTWLRGTRVDSVRYVSQKGLLLDYRAGRFARPLDPGYEEQIAVAFADGSASWRHPEPRQAEYWGVQRVGLGAGSWPIMTTRGGLCGRDF